MIDISSKRVLIITSETDASADKVIDWLYYFGWGATRINMENLDSYFPLVEPHDNGINIDGVCASEFHSVWFNKYFNKEYNLFLKSQSLSSDLKNQWNIFVGIRGELLAFNENILLMIKDMISSSLGSPEQYFINKIYVLRKAYDFGIDTPSTIVTSSKKELINFINQYNIVITKSIDSGLDYFREGKIYTNYTETLPLSILDEIPETFFPSYFQEKLTKYADIRTFYIKNKFYSIAIFSQLDMQTETDYRRYNTKRGNRQVPIILPEEYKEKLEKLMSFFRLDTGSIDSVLTTEGRFVFLEINPVGQFGKLSISGNYYIEKILAESLIETG